MKHTYRLPPCSRYDLEGMESWLSDMAREGLVLAEDGFFGGFATFERTQPKVMRYRLNAAPSLPTMFNDYDAPSGEAMEMSADMGWKYVCRRGSFYIYCTEDPAARELNTDPEVQALTIKSLQRQQCRELCFLLLYFVLYGALRQFTYGNVGLFLLWIAMGTGFFLFTLVILFELILNRLIPILRLGRLRRKLKANGDLEHHKPWRRGIGRYWVGCAIKYLVTLLWLVCACVVLYQSSNDVGEVRLEHFDGAVPFPTVEDFVEGSYAPDNSLIPGTVKQWSDPLSPVNFDYHEIATVTRSDGTRWEANLYVDYHETVSPWLAQRLAEDYCRYYHEEYAALTLPDLGVDYAAAFNDHGTHLILRHGSTVVHAYLFQYSEYTLTPEEWTGILANYLIG